MKKPEIINLLMAGDSNVYEGICLTTLSAIKQTKVPIHLYIFTLLKLPSVNGITEIQAQKLRSIMKEKNEKNELTLIDATPDYLECFNDSPNKKTMYTPCSLLRLFLTRYIDCDRLIYLDADTMVCRSLEEFFTIDIDEKEMAIALDYLGTFWIKKDYFNSGVLFINIPKVKETNLFENAIDILKKKPLLLADQTALYLCCKQKVYMPWKYNEQRSIKKDTVIKHFNKGIVWFPFHTYNIKQWQREKVHKRLKIHDFDDIYEEYDKYFKK